MRCFLFKIWFLLDAIICAKLIKMLTWQRFIALGTYKLWRFYHALIQLYHWVILHLPVIAHSHRNFLRILDGYRLLILVWSRINYLLGIYNLSLDIVGVSWHLNNSNSILHLRICNLLHNRLLINSLNTALRLVLLLLPHIVLPLYLVSKSFLLRTLHRLNLKAVSLILVIFWVLILSYTDLINWWLLLLPHVHFLSLINLHEIRLCNLLKLISRHILVKVDFLVILEHMWSWILFSNLTLD